MKFNYTKLPSLDPISGERGDILRPIISIDISHNSGWFSDVYQIQLTALIDSGADRNVAPLPIAKMLGVDLSKIKPIETSGIGKGTVSTYYTMVYFKIGGYEYEAPIGFGDSFPMILLGGQGFFDHWKVNFDYPRDIEIKFKTTFH
jgi:hypothetical protein